MNEGTDFTRPFDITQQLKVVFQDVALPDRSELFKVEDSYSDYFLEALEEHGWDWEAMLTTIRTDRFQLYYIVCGAMGLMTPKAFCYFTPLFFLLYMDDLSNNIGDNLSSALYPEPHELFPGQSEMDWVYAYESSCSIWRTYSVSQRKAIAGLTLLIRANADDTSTRIAQMIDREEPPIDWFVPIK